MGQGQVYEEDSYKRIDISADKLRQQIQNDAKDFKTSWVNLGRALYAVWQDKLYYGWGFEKFEYYIQKEIGLKSQIAVKLLKAYIFLEKEEPAYLKNEFSQDRNPSKVPTYEAINVLRLAKQNKGLSRDDYNNLREEIFEKGKNESAVRRDLTAMMKQRKEVDPEQDRQQRNTIALRRLVNSLRSFKKDIETLKLCSADIVSLTDQFLKRLEVEMGDKSATA